MTWYEIWNRPVKHRDRRRLRRIWISKSTAGAMPSLISATDYEHERNWQSTKEVAQEGISMCDQWRHSNISTRLVVNRKDMDI